MPQIVNPRAFKWFSHHTQDHSLVGRRDPLCSLDDDIGVRDLMMTSVIP